MAGKDSVEARQRKEKSGKEEDMAKKAEKRKTDAAGVEAKQNRVFTE